MGWVFLKYRSVIVRSYLIPVLFALLQTLLFVKYKIMSCIVPQTVLGHCAMENLLNIIFFLGV